MCWNEYMERFQSDPQVIAYKAFMYDEGNAYNCEGCPENATGKYKGCGQQNCWVTVHNKER